MKAAILFLIYKRPEETRRVFDQIAVYRPTRLYVAADGPRHHSEDESIRLCRKIATKVSWDCEVITLFRDRNLGCRNAVSQAIDWFFDLEEAGIILEDDCLPDPSFFDFCEKLLNLYKDTKQIGMISGTNRFQEDFTSMDDSYFFASNASIWGWASWKRAWKHYDVQMSDWPEKKQTDLLFQHTFSFLEKWRRQTTYDDVQQGRIDTWDYQWTYARQKQGLLSIIPRLNLISNIGLTSQGTHVSNQALMGIEVGKLEDPLIHPEEITINKRFDQMLSKQIISEGYLRNLLYLLVKRPLFTFLHRKS